MKIEVTKKNVFLAFPNVVEVPHAFSVTYSLEPDFYTTGAYGWNADVYRLSRTTVLVQGDRPFSNMTMPSDVAADFEKVWTVLTVLRDSDKNVESMGNEFPERFTCELINAWILSKGKDDFAELYRKALYLFRGNNDVVEAVGKALTVQGFDVPVFVTEANY